MTGIGEEGEVTMSETRVAVVSGGASGIGRATAARFLAAGMAVVLLDRDEEAGAVACEALGGEVSFRACDVTDEAQVAAAIDAAVAQHGRLDVAVNSAGVPGSATQAVFADYATSEFDRILGVNLRGVFLCLKHELRVMQPHVGAAIVNLSSIYGLVGRGLSPAYVSAKHGVIGLTRTAALDYAAAGIRVNAVCPGVVETPIIGGMSPDARQVSLGRHPLGRFGQADEVAALIAWLCSDEASFVTGAAIPVDGGFVAQ